MSHETVMWLVFGAVVVGMLVLDLGVFQRKAHEVKIREALVWSCVWVALALVFMLGIWYELGHEKAMEYLAGYVIEKSLSVDNLFVFLLIFSYFKVGKKYQHMVLFWGIISALVMRAAFIGLGVAVIHYFDWVIYVFGGFLVFTGFKMLFHHGADIDPEKGVMVRFCRKFLRVLPRYEEGKFFARVDGRLHATLMFLVLMVIETSDVIFAVDSIPAVLAITTDPFIVYSSNVFAILGLRALYFALAGVMSLFHYLHQGLSIVLMFVGVKMVLPKGAIPIQVALLVILGVLTVSILASLAWPKKGVLAIPERAVGTAENQEIDTDPEGLQGKEE